MLSKKPLLLLKRCAIVIYMALFITGCSSENEKPDVSAIDVNVKAERFEKDLFSGESETSALMKSMTNKYGDFFRLFLYQITAIGSRDSVLTAEHLRDFISDTNFHAIYRDCEKVYSDFSAKESELSKAFRYYKYYFPGKIIPKVVTLITGFSYPVVCDSTTLGIGLDMYLGPSYKFYNTLEPPLPAYLRNRMHDSYMVCNAMKGWAMSDYAIDETTAKMIDFMISQGRILYFLDKVTPDEPDTIKTGYTKDQLRWCFENEGKTWSFLIENNLLFSTDPNQMNKFVNDGPTTNGFPKESPGNIGQFIGWQIVKSYMINNKEVALQKLMEEKDLMKIFNLSKYKPRK